MNANMKITTKIYLGFAVAVLICLVLGIYGIWNFASIRGESTILTQEYVPEVDILSKLERNTFKTMYNIRGFSMTGQERFLDLGMESLEGTHEQIKDAQELLTHAPHLVALAAKLESIQASLKKYKSLVDETNSIHKMMAAGRETLNSSATDVMKNAEEFVHSQNEAAAKEIASGASKDKLTERLSKINHVNDIVQLLDASRISVWKSQYLGETEGLQKALPNFVEISRKLKEIRSITRMEQHLRELDQIESSSHKYSLAIEETIRNMQKMVDVNGKRNEVAQEVLESIENTTRAGVDGTRKIANSTSSLVSTSILMFSIGLLVAMIVSGVLAFLISSGVGRALRGIIEKLKDSSQQVTESATQLSSAAQQLSGASNEQASSIEETSSSLEEISGMIENNVSNAEQSFKLSSEVMSVSETANESMRKLEISIKEILSSNEKIEQLVKVIGKIGEKTKVMDEIVFQTKLLSFNASVEAERAGEHGRGFAVVAQEVGNLAQMSGKSAQEIAEIVTSSIHEAEAITTENRKKVDQGNQYVEESAKGLKMILEAARTVSSGSNQVLQASKDQAAGIKQVGSAMTALDNATQQNAATAEETAASSEELSAQAEVLNSIVVDLYALVEGQSMQHQGMIQTSSVSKPAMKNNGKVVNLAQRRKTNRPQSALQKKVVGSDMDHSGGHDQSDEAWEKL